MSMTDFQQGVVAAAETAVHILREWGSPGTIHRIDEHALKDLLMDVQRRTPRPPAAPAENASRTQCDRAELVIQRALSCGWITFNTSVAHSQFHATLRIALNMEVEARGPYPVESAPPLSTSEPAEAYIQELRTAIGELLDALPTDFPHRDRYNDLTATKPAGAPSEEDMARALEDADRRASQRISRDYWNYLARSVLALLRQTKE
jgi:hypothetical protein